MRYAARMAKTTPGTKVAEQLFIDHAILPGTPPRHMEIRVPSPEQLAVWSSVGERFTQLGAEWGFKLSELGERADDDPELVAFRQKQNQQANRGLLRAMKIIRSVLATEEDYLWVEDQIMDGATLEQALGVVSAAAARLRERAVRGNPAPEKATRTKLVA